MKTPGKRQYAETATEAQKAEFRKLCDQGVSEEMAWRIVYDEPDANQPYENWPKAELELLAAKRGLKESEKMSKEALIDALRLP